MYDGIIIFMLLTHNWKADFVRNHVVRAVCGPVRSAETAWQTLRRNR